MNYNIDYMANLIGKDLTGEITADEKMELEAWRQETASNEKYYQQMKSVFEQSAQLKTWQQFDTDEAWIQVRRMIRTPKPDTVRSLQPAAFPYWRVAAAVALLAVAGYAAYQRFFTPQDVLQVASVERAQENTLPDGTQVYLNKASSVAYEYNPVKRNRRVKLKGEAYFKIAEHAEEQFVLEASDVIIEDIGTTFNVKAYPERDEVEVFVESGEVAFYTKENPGIRVLAGETGVYNKITKTFTKSGQADDNTLAYKTRVFIFRDTEMSSVVETINEVYMVKLRLENKTLENCRITVTFQDESIDVIADIIAETLKLTLEKTENEIVLKGTECGK